MRTAKTEHYAAAKPNTKDHTLQYNVKGGDDMDGRTALTPGTPLHFHNSKGEEMHFVITGEIGRGNSCIVYEACRENENGDRTLYRIKELYPYKIKIQREESGRLVPCKAETEKFRQMCERFSSDFSRTNKLFYSGENYALMTNQLGILRLNGTLYIVSAYSSRKTLAEYKPENIKECVSLVRQAACILGGIHAGGYLYLDVKPDNILIEDGYPKRIRLFDFDSLLSIEELKNPAENVRLSYTSGFAPVELQTVNLRTLGAYTDVFGVGALLFFLLFGKTPAAPECEKDCEYDFSSINYVCSECDDRFFSTLSDFFHNSLAIFRGDRYADMETVCKKLSEIEKYADITVPRIFSTKLVRPKYLFGRENELAKMDELLSYNDTDLIFVTGMGGIGKSTFIREYLSTRRSEFDTVLYIRFKGNIVSTLSDDITVEINTLRKSDIDTSDESYFYRKLRKIRELIRGTSAVLAIDDFRGGSDEYLRAVIETGWKVILVSRQSPPVKDCSELKLSSVSENALLQIFESGLGRRISEDEREDFQHIARQTDGHTLVLELVGKQIASSHLSISAACELTEKYGFTAVAPEKVDYEKDELSGYDTIGNIIDALFQAGALSDEKKILLKIMSLVGDGGIEINLIHSILNIPSKDGANELIKDGWINIYGDVVSLHSVVRETVCRWEWKAEYISAARVFLRNFYEEIKSRLDENSVPLNIEKTSLLFSQTEEILFRCEHEPILQKEDIYIRLLYITALNAPEGNFTHHGITILLDNRERLDLAEMMCVLDAAVQIYANKSDFDKAQSLVSVAEKTAENTGRNDISALYHHLLAGYYDILLDGHYDAETEEENSLLCRLLDAVDKTIAFSENETFADNKYLYANSLLGKAVILMRSGQGGAEELKRLLDTAYELIDEQAPQYAEERLNCCLAYGWYFALICGDVNMTNSTVEKALELSQKIILSDFRRLEDVIIPCANMLFELQSYEKAIALLDSGAQLCNTHKNTDIYAEIKQQLCNHIWQVGIEGRAFGQCEEIMKRIDSENDEIIDPENKVNIPADVRRIIEENV